MRPASISAEGLLLTHMLQQTQTQLDSIQSAESHSPNSCCSSSTASPYFFSFSSRETAMVAMLVWIQAEV